MTRYILTIDAKPLPGDPDGIRRLKSLLKRMLRDYRLRCVSCLPVEIPMTDDVDARETTHE